MNFEPELHLEGALAGPRLFELDLVVGVDREIDLRERDILLGIEVVGEVLVREDLLAEDEPLARIDPAEFARTQRAAVDNDARGRSGF